MGPDIIGTNQKEELTLVKSALDISLTVSHDFEKYLDKQD